MAKAAVTLKLRLVHSSSEKVLLDLERTDTQRFKLGRVLAPERGGEWDEAVGRQLLAGLVEKLVSRLVQASLPAN